MHLRAPLALAALLALAASPADATAAAPARRPAVLPWIADDYPRAVALARQRHLPLFVENWAPW